MVGNNNAVNINTQGTVYFKSGVFSGIDGSTAAKVLTSNGTGVAPSFQTLAATGIQTIDGDSGSITGGTVTIYANNSSNTCGKSVSFVNSGTTSTLNVTNANDSTYIGQNSGNTTSSGECSIGYGCLASSNSTGGNTALGYNALINAGTYNVAVGYEALNSFAGTSGNYNIAIGYQAGTNYTGSESSNILLNNPGVAAESNVCRIGAATGTGNQQLSTVYIFGINGVTPSAPVLVTIDSSTSQLGTQALTEYYTLTGGASNAVNLVAPSTTNYVLTSNGASSQPSFQGNILPRVATEFGTSAAPTGTTSTTLVMLGLGGTWKLTPSAYTVVRVTIDGQCTNGTTGDGISFVFAYGTSSAPSNGAAATGTTVGSTITFTDLTGLLTNGVPFAKDIVITGLTAGTAYWFDLQFEAVTGGTASFLNLEFSAQELTS